MNMIPIIELYDDAQIKALLVQHDRGAELEPWPELPRPFRLHLFWTDNTNWYVVTHFFGYPDACDNGYKAIIIPASGLQPHEIEEIIRRFTDEGATGPIAYSELRELKTEKN